MRGVGYNTRHLLAKTFIETKAQSLASRKDVQDVQTKQQEMALELAHVNSKLNTLTDISSRRVQAKEQALLTFVNSFLRLSHQVSIIRNKTPRLSESAWIDDLEDPTDELYNEFTYSLFKLFIYLDRNTDADLSAAVTACYEVATKIPVNLANLVSDLFDVHSQWLLANKKVDLVFQFVERSTQAPAPQSFNLDAMFEERRRCQTEYLRAATAGLRKHIAPLGSESGEVLGKLVVIMQQSLGVRFPDPATLL